MTEIRYIEGLVRHVGRACCGGILHLAIDNCASGGRRIDLETIGRSTALWRTDWPVDAIHRQCHTFGLLAWVPLHMTDGRAGYFLLLPVIDASPYCRDSVPES